MVVEIPSKKIIRREDNGAFLGAVGSEYQIIPHGQVINHARQELISTFGETSEKHVLRGGKLMSFFELPTVKIGNRQDVATPTVRIINSYDGSSSLVGLVEIVRMICKNGIIRSDKMIKFSLKHTKGTTDFRIENLIESLSERIENDSLFYNSLADRLNNAPVIVDVDKLPKKWNDLAHEVYPLEFGYNQNQHNAWTQFNAYTNAISHSEVSIETKDLMTKQVIQFFSQAVSLV
jgi:hypothetical protein